MNYYIAELAKGSLPVVKLFLAQSPNAELVWRATMTTDCSGCVVIKINLELRAVVSNCSCEQRLLFRMMSHALLHPHNMDTDSNCVY